MRRKIVLSTTITTIVLALALFCFGVYASMTQQFSMTNTIGFTASTDVFTSFRGEISGAIQTDLTSPPQGYNTLEEYKNEKKLVYQELFEEAYRAEENRQTSFNWAIGEKLEFKNLRDPIIYMIEIKNYSEVKIKINLSYVAVGEKIENTVSCQTTGNAHLSSPSAPQNISSYNSGQVIELDEYVIGQAGQAEPASCVFYISTSVKSSVITSFEESNNFAIVAEVK